MMSWVVSILRTLFFNSRTKYPGCDRVVPLASGMWLGAALVPINIELFPPVDDLVNDAHVYHLWLLPEDYAPPASLNLAHKYRW